MGVDHRAALLFWSRSMLLSEVDMSSSGETQNTPVVECVLSSPCMTVIVQEHRPSHPHNAGREHVGFKLDQEGIACTGSSLPRG